MPALQRRLLPLAALVLAGCGPSQQATIFEFSFERLDASGAKYTGSGDFAQAPWSCVRDLNSGLIWEVKTAGTGPRSSTNTYTWYAPDNESDGELDYRGTPNGGRCTGSDCDISAYVKYANEAGLCGIKEWRLPTKDEFATISDPRKPLKRPTIDVAYFPETQPAEYWTANDYSFMHDAAWGWNFEYSHDRVDWKKSPKFVRLVHGQLKPRR